MTLEDLGVKIDALATQIDTRLNELKQGQTNIASQIEELNLEVGAVDTRIKNVETVVHQLASKAGVQSIPALGGGRTSSLPRAAKGKSSP